MRIEILCGVPQQFDDSELKCFVELIHSRVRESVYEDW